MNNPLPLPINRFEKLLLAVSKPPGHATYLLPTGLLVMPVFHALFPDSDSILALTGVLLAVLMTLRLGAAVLRRCLPISAPVKQKMLHQRILAKRHDSYQWQKLFWVGWGIAAGWMLSSQPQNIQAILAVASIIAGAIGLACWKSHAKAERDARDVEAALARNNYVRSENSR